MDSYWNHNVAFHNLLVADSKIRGGRVLDIGCGEGLLIQRLIPCAKHVTGVDPDVEAIRRAKKRLGTPSNVTLIHGDFLTMPVPAQEERFDTIICVATLHHMELRTALSRMRKFLAPGGRLLIVGLAADKSIWDYLLSGLLLIPIRVMDWFHGGVQEIGVKIATPNESLKEIRQVARIVLPRAKIQYRFYYRYLLSWDLKTEKNKSSSFWKYRMKVR